MKITKSHLRKIIQEELREMTDTGAAMAAAGGGERDEKHGLIRSYMEELTSAMLSLKLFPVSNEITVAISSSLISMIFAIL